MCDYSLCGLPNRLAQEGEELVVHKFTTGSMGMASPADLPSTEPAREAAPKHTFWQTITSWQMIKSFFEPSQEAAVTPAVCIPPGARLIVKDVPPDLQRQLHIMAEEGVVFTQVSADVNSYRDAIRFQNGCQVRLQELREGMRVEVLSLAGVPSVVGEDYPALTHADR
jgi:hypothetical protein